jgi:hypothetical protein
MVVEKALELFETIQNIQGGNYHENRGSAGYL